MQIVDCRTKSSTEVEMECNKNDGGATKWLKPPDTDSIYSDTSDAIVVDGFDDDESFHTMNT